MAFLNEQLSYNFNLKRRIASQGTGIINFFCGGALVVSLSCWIIPPCLPNKYSTWHNWVQGIGSIVAIASSATAVGLGHWLRKVEPYLKLEELQEEDDFADRLATVQYYRETSRIEEMNAYLEGRTIRQALPQETSPQPAKFDLKRYLVEEATGILITGNSGAGKTSSAVEIAGMLTESTPAEIIVLDPHFNDQWPEAGLQAISRIEEIELAISSLLKELDARHERKRLGLPNGRKVLVITDELLSCKKRFLNPKKVGDALSRLSTEGRKRDMLFLGISHSPNADDIDISAEVRTSFAVIKLCKSAQKHVSNFWEKSDPRKAYILNHPGYPAIVADGVDEIVDHPTHAHHPQFKKNGNQPKYQHKINQLSWTTLNLDGSWKASNLTSDDGINTDCEDNIKPSGENRKGTPKSDKARKIDLAKPPEDEKSSPNISLEDLLNLVLDYAQQEGKVTVRDVQRKWDIGQKYKLSSEAISGIFTELEIRGFGNKIDADSLGKIYFKPHPDNPRAIDA